jgi:hypothetical protein
VEKIAEKFRTFSEAEKANRDFYKKLTGNERLKILVELLNHDENSRLDHSCWRIRKLGAPDE